MHLQSLCRSHNHGQTGLQTGLAALDVVELLGTKVCTEAGLGHHIVTIRHGQLGGQHRVATVGNVGKRTAVYERRGVLGSLHQIGRKGVLEQHADRSGNAQIFHRQRLIVGSEAQQDVLDTAAQVLLVSGQAEDGHDFGSRSDVEARLAGDAVGLAPQASDNVAQPTVVHVEHTVPQHLLHGKTVVLILVHIVVQQSRNHVVGRCNGMEIPRKMKVDFLHRQHLGITASGRTALHAETGTQRRFAQGTDGLLADAVQSECQPHRDGGLADTGLGRRDGRHQDQMAALHALLVNQAFGHLGNIASVVLYFVNRYIVITSYLLDFFQLYAASYFDV